LLERTLSIVREIEARLAPTATLIVKKRKGKNQIPSKASGGENGVPTKLHVEEKEAFLNP